MCGLKFFLTFLLVLSGLPGVAWAETTGVTPGVVETGEPAPPADEAQACNPGIEDTQSVGYRCASGVLNNVIDLLQLPGNILQLVALGQQRIAECNANPEIKRGMLLVVEPLLRDGIESYMDNECTQLMQMIRLLEEQGTRDVLRKLRLQESLRRLMAASPPETEAQRQVFAENLENVGLTPEQQQFWDRKMVREEHVGRINAAARQRTWNRVRQEWECMTVRDAAAGLCQAIADIGLGGVTAVGGRMLARRAGDAINTATTRALAAGDRALERADDVLEQRRLVAGEARIERMAPDPDRDEVFNRTLADDFSFADEARQRGFEFSETGELISVDPRASELAATIHRLQSQYGVNVRGQSSGFSSLVTGARPGTGQVFLNLDPQDLLTPQQTLRELQELEQRLRFSRRHGVFPDTTHDSLVVHNPTTPLASRLTNLQQTYGAELRLRRTSDPLGAEGTNVTYSPSGRLEIHPELFAPGMERRLQREIDLAQNNLLEPLRIGRRNAAETHGLEVGRAGELIAPANPATPVARMVHRLQELGIRVTMDPNEFVGETGLSDAAGFARGNGFIAIRPDYFTEERAASLLSILNHEVTHITSNRRLADVGQRLVAGQMTLATTRVYAGRSIEFQSEGVDFFSSSSFYNDRFRADELDARIREANIGYRSGVQSPRALATRAEALAFAQVETTWLTRAQGIPSPNVSAVMRDPNRSLVSYRVPEGDGFVNINIPVFHPTGATTDEIRRIARQIIEERILRTRQQATRLQQRGR